MFAYPCFTSWRLGTISLAINSRFPIRKRFSPSQFLSSSLQMMTSCHRRREKNLRQSLGFFPIQQHLVLQLISCILKMHVCCLTPNASKQKQSLQVLRGARTPCNERTTLCNELTTFAHHRCSQVTDPPHKTVDSMGCAPPPETCIAML